MRGRRCSARVGRRSRRAHRDRGGSASSPVPARPDDARFSQRGHMVGERRLGDLKILEGLAGAELLPIPEQLDDAEAVDVSECLEVRCEAPAVELAGDDAGAKPDDPLLDEAQKAAHMVNADERAWIHKACLGSECSYHA